MCARDRMRPAFMSNRLQRVRRTLVAPDSVPATHTHPTSVHTLSSLTFSYYVTSPVTQTFDLLACLISVHCNSVVNLTLSRTNSNPRDILKELADLSPRMEHFTNNETFQS